MDESVTLWIQRLKQGDKRSEQEIWNRYFQRVVALARNKIAAIRARDFDEEDVALSAFNSFFRAVELERFPRLEDRTDLWKLLVVITVRKATAHRRRVHAAKRGGAKVQGESVLAADEEFQNGLNQVLGAEPTPEVAAEIAENYLMLMRQLPDAELRRVAQLKFEGNSNQEIAAMLDCAERTVERKLARIRTIWTDGI